MFSFKPDPKKHDDVAPVGAHHGHAVPGAPGFPPCSGIPQNHGNQHGHAISRGHVAAQAMPHGQAQQHGHEMPHGQVHQHGQQPNYLGNRYSQFASVAVVEAHPSSNGLNQRHLKPR